MNKKFRKQNITGIKGLSIGTTKNSKGDQLTRYCVNYKNGEQCVGRSFYFGSNNSQIDAFKSAIEYMIDSDIYSNTIKNALDAYKGNNHISLFVVSSYVLTQGTTSKMA